MIQTAYTKRTRDGNVEYVTSTGYVFSTEREAQLHCEMWNAHWSAMDAISNVPSSLNRAEYEAACKSAKVSPLSDSECDSYGVRYGDFVPWLDKGENGGYPPETCVQMALARRRLRAIDEEREAARAAQPAPQPDYPNGRKLDCGHVVYWKSEVMSASRGTSCPDCYDRMSD